MKDSHTPNRPIRVDAELWDAFGALVGPRNRSAILRDFIRWYIRERGARLPDRPTPERIADVRRAAAGSD
ncbi:hypothetical protein [Planobispora rosea]|uniref:hypothetical protein n=1 Tax=Planobispora rosea TaxID=35762 RepID=UPI00114D1182|nr:hypothetical protein [Planobispora rosea]